MIDRVALLSDLQKLLQRLEADLLERSESVDVPEVGKTLRAEYDRAKTAERTAQNYEDWRTDAITQAAAAWVLSCVFVRFLEDNRLIDPPKIAGPAERLERARDEHELHFRSHPKQTDRDYLLAVFDQLAKLPGTKDVFGEHNPIRELPNWLSGDAAGELLKFFQRIDANTGALVHDFTDPNWDTRFLGDLYQDLSEAARKKYALLQTPEFVEEFILDRTLNPALDEFGLDAGPVLGSDGKPLTEAGFRMIDPACGSGHFLLGAFPRILDRWQRKEPGTNVRELVQRTLDSIHGVDVNPYAVAIARFRLLLAAMRACGVTRLADAPGFRLNLACGDSLLHAPLKTGQQVFDFEITNGDAECDHAYQSEDLPILKKMLRGGQYHAVVANPPYIVPRDAQLNERYRKRFRSCYRQYSLAVPFLERILKLATPGGYTGQITANSFMKREFGKKLIEAFLPTVDLTHVIDTSGAYVPGHGTPTVILFGRNKSPVASTLRTVLGIRGEPATPDDAAHGLVWSAIVAQVDQPGSQSEFVSVGDSPRELFHKHPWSIGGGGAAELKDQLDENASSRLYDVIDETGFVVITGEDNVLLIEAEVPRRLCHFHTRPLADGEVVRDWSVETRLVTLWPNDPHGNRLAVELLSKHLSFLWPYRTSLKERKAFGIPVEKKGIPWWALREVYPSKLRTPLSIVFAFVATHNHFVLDRGGRVFNRSAPVIKLPADASEDDHLALLGLLNCSTACFWMKQIFHDKGSTVDAHGARQTTVAFENFREFTGTGLLKFPLPEDRPLEFARQLDRLAQQLAENSPATAIVRWQAQPGPELAKEHSLRQCLDDAFIVTTLIRGEMLLVQEDLDWECYRLYGLIDEDLTVRLSPGDEDRCIPPANRAFEIVLARKIAAGEAQSTWFERHGMTANTELPDPAYNAKYREIVARRIEVIESNPEIALIEQPEYKRRWNWEPWESQKERALRDWLLNRLESYFDFDGRMNDRNEPSAEIDISLISVAKLADIADHDSEFHQVGAALQGDLAFDIPRLVADLVAAESVPLLPILRYKPSGLRKRAEWEQTWDLQRREDAGEDVGAIPVPPKYTSADFISTGGARYWSLRGKLDVPKERWISFPHCEGPDGTLVVCWAGYDHLQQARAISAYYVRVQTEFGGTDDARLIPLLACLIELLPWLKQWHNDPDPAFDGMRMGDYFEGFVNEEARQLNKTLPEIKAWTPPARTGRRGRK
jgi:hypothetical protein